jgi:hypothetical protein
MGYRSDVTILFYGGEKDYPILKLWIQENLEPVLKEYGWNDLEPYERHNQHNSLVLKGFVFKASDVKWYDSYPDVKAMEDCVTTFNETFGENNKTELAFDYIRLGEEYEDIEVRYSDHSYNILNVNREVVFD